MKQKKNKNQGIMWLIIALVVVLLGGVVFMGAVSGWFDDQKVILDAEYYGDGAEFMELTASEYEDLAKAKKSFVIFVDQGGCTTADRLRGYMTDYMKEKGFLAYKMMFKELKESSLHEFVKYYPSVVMVSDGRVVGFLRADADEDAEIYNNYEAFKGWMAKFL